MELFISCLTRALNADDFQSLAKMKGWDDAQKSKNVIALIGGDLARNVELIVSAASAGSWGFDQFYTEVGLLSVPDEYSEDLDNKLWTMKKLWDESVLRFSQRLC